MKTRPSLVAILLIFTLTGIVLFRFVIPFIKITSSYDHLESNAQKVVSGSELQNWAINLLEKYPDGYSANASRMGTNFPPQLLGLYHVPPAVLVLPDLTNEKGEVTMQKHVAINWGGGSIGHCGFYIGYSNFVWNTHEWQPGVYFWSEYPQK